MHFSVHARLGIAPNIGSQVVKELPPSPSSPGVATRFEGTNRTLFRTFRAMSTIVQNFFAGNWLSKRIKKSQFATIAQFSTESAEEPTIEMASSAAALPEKPSYHCQKGVGG